MSEVERLMRYVWENDVTGCWIWRGATSDEGYGKANRPTGDGWVSVMAHRYMYELIRGPIGDGLETDHLCLVPRCVNPEHLEPVTAAENQRRKNAIFMVCRNGHPRTPENTYFRPGSSKRRGCIVCERERTRRHKAKRGVA